MLINVNEHLVSKIPKIIALGVYSQYFVDVIFPILLPGFDKLQSEINLRKDIFAATACILS